MTTDSVTLVLTAYLIMAAVMVGLWILQLRVRNVSIADVGWCAGLIAVGEITSQGVLEWYGMALSPEYSGAFCFEPDSPCICMAGMSICQKRPNARRLPEMTKVTGAVQILIFLLSWHNPCSPRCRSSA